MENQQQNEETTSNGIELLENVIKSNERTVASNMEKIEQYVIYNNWLKIYKI